MMLKVNELNIDVVKNNLKQKIALPIDITEFINEGYFSDDWGTIDDNTPAREKNRILEHRKKLVDEGLVLDIQTLNVMCKIYDMLSPRVQKKVDKALNNPDGLISYIDKCWELLGSTIRRS